MNSAVGYTVLCFLFVPFVGVISIWGEWHSHQPQPKGEWRRGKKRQVANLFGIVTGLLRTAGIDCCLPETRQCCSKLFDVWNAVWIFLPPSLWSPRRSQHLQMRQSFHGRCSRPHPRHSTSDENEIHTACCIACFHSARGILQRYGSTRKVQAGSLWGAKGVFVPHWKRLLFSDSSL